MKQDNLPIYWVLFYNHSQALQALYDYQKEHWEEFPLKEPPYPKQQVPKIPVEVEELDIEKFMKEAPSRRHDAN